MTRPEIRARNTPFQQGALAEGTTPLPPRCKMRHHSIFVFFPAASFFAFRSSPMTSPAAPSPFGDEYNTYCTYKTFLIINPSSINKKEERSRFDVEADRSVPDILFLLLSLVDAGEDSSHQLSPGMVCYRTSLISSVRRDDLGRKAVAAAAAGAKEVPEGILQGAGTM